MKSSILPFGLLFAATLPAFAADFTWNGGSTVNSNWGTATNWSTGTAPPNNGSADIIISGSQRFTPIVNTAWNINTLTFSATSKPFTLDGSNLTLESNGIVPVSPLIINSSSHSHIINNNLIFSNNGTINASTGNLSFGGTYISNDGNTVTLTAASGRTLVFDTILTGLGNYTKNGVGTALLNNNSIYSGTTTISGGTFELTGSINSSETINLTAGTLRLLNSERLANAAVMSIASGSTFDLNGFTETISTLTGAGAITLGTGGALTLNHSSASLTFSGVISEAGSFTKAGLGTLTLSGANSYTGPTSITGGTLRLGANNVIGNSSTVSLAAGTSFNMDGKSDTVANLSGSGTILLGSDILNPGFLSFGANNLDVTFTGAIAGIGSATKTGSGLWTVSAAGSITPAVALNVSQGILRLGVANGLGTTTALNVASGATFDKDGYLQTLGSLAGAGSVTLGSTNLTAGGSNTDTTFSGIISGTGGLVKNGSGIFTLSGANTYTGVTTINTGALTLGVSNALSNSTNITVNANGSLALLGSVSDTVGSLSGSGNVILNSGTLTVSSGNNSAFSGSMLGLSTGTFRKSGTGTLLLSGNNQGHDGAIAVLAGALTASHKHSLGSSNGQTTVSSGATLQLNQIPGERVVETIQIAGAGLNGNGALRLTPQALNGPITDLRTQINLTANATIRTEGTLPGDFANLSNRYASINIGTHNLRIEGGGKLALSSTFNPDDYPSLPAPDSYRESDTYFTGLENVKGIVGSGTVTIAGSLETESHPDFTGSFVVENGGNLSVACYLGQGTYASGTNDYISPLGTGLSGTTVHAGGSLTIRESKLRPPGGLYAITNPGNTVHNEALSLAGTLRLQSDIRWVGSQDIALAGSSAQIEMSSIDHSSFGYFSASLSGSGKITGNGTDLALRHINNTVLTDREFRIDRNIELGAGSLSINSGVSSAFGGIITLAKPAAYSGSTTIHAGRFHMLNANLLPDFSRVSVSTDATLDLITNSETTLETIGALEGAGVVTMANGSLTIGGANLSTIFSGVIDGSTSSQVIKQGTGKLILQGNNTYSGGTLVRAGTLTPYHQSSLGPGTGGTVVEAGASLELEALEQGPSSIYLEPITITGTGDAGKGALLNGAGTSITLQGAISLAGDALIRSHSYPLFPGIIRIYDEIKLFNHTLSLSGDKDSTIAVPAAINGAGSIAVFKSPVDTTQDLFNVTLSAENSFTGSLTIGNRSRVTLNHNLALGGTSNGVSVTDGILRISPNIEIANQPLTMGNDATLYLAESSSWTGNADIILEGSNAWIQFDDESIISGTGQIAGDNVALLLTPFTASSINRTLNLGNGSLAISGFGDLRLGKPATYTGNTTIQSGMLTAGIANVLPDATAVSISANGAFNLNNFTDTIGSLAGAGAVSLGTGTLTAGANDGSTTFSGIINGSGGFTKSGSGTLTINNIQAYTGSTRILAGSLRSMGNGTIHQASDVLIASAGTWDINGVSQNVSSLAGEGFVNLGSGAVTLTLGGGNLSTTYSGTITGIGQITKQGTGTFTLSGPNDFNGQLSIMQGAVTAASNQALGNDFLNVFTALGGALQVTGGLTIGKQLVLQGFGPGNQGALIKLAGGGESVMTGSLTVINNTIINNNDPLARLRLTGNVDLGASQLIFGGYSHAVEGDIDGTGPLGVSLLQPTSLMRLEGDSNFSGGLYVIQGIVQAAADGSLGTGDIFVGVNGWLDLGTGITISNQTLNLQGILGSEGSSHWTGASAINLTGNASIIRSISGEFLIDGTGAVSGTDTDLELRAETNSSIRMDRAVNLGAGGLQIMGLGQVLLNGNVNHTGTTVVHQGTLAINGNKTGGGAVTVATAGTLAGNGNINGTTTVNGTLAPGSSEVGTLTFDTNLELTAGSNCSIQITGTAQNDRILAPALTANGTITVNLGTFIPSHGETFDLADASISGSPSFAFGDSNAADWDTSSFATQGTIQYIGGPTPYDTWADENEVTGGKFDDDDNDGVPNILEFATNSDPKDGKSRARTYPLMFTLGPDRALTFTVASRAGSSFSASGTRQTATQDGIIYTIEATNDLDVWTVEAVTELNVSESASVRTALGETLPQLQDGWQWNTFRTAGSADTDSEDYIRLKVDAQ